MCAGLIHLQIYPISCEREINSIEDIGAKSTDKYSELWFKIVPFECQKTTTWKETKSSNTWLHVKCYQIQNKETDSELLYHKYQ